MERFSYPESAAFFGIAAFCVAASIFVAVVWRALRMSRRQVEQFSKLPFETEKPAGARTAGTAAHPEGHGHEGPRTGR